MSASSAGIRSARILDSLELHAIGGTARVMVGTWPDVPLYRARGFVDIEPGPTSLKNTDRMDRMDRMCSNMMVGNIPRFTSVAASGNRSKPIRSFGRS